MMWMNPEAMADEWVEFLDEWHAGAYEEDSEESSEEEGTAEG